MVLGTRPEASGENLPMSQEASNCQEGIGKPKDSTIHGGSGHRGHPEQHLLWACCFQRGIQGSGLLLVNCVRP